MEGGAAVSGKGHRLRAARRQKLLTLRALAKRTGVALHTIHNIEQGRHEPSFTTMQKLCDALEMERNELWGPDEEAARLFGIGGDRP
jgi:transcriptional regulator with XRE-family HTH domain